MNRTCSSMSFRALLAVQFLGAFNDNLLKIIIHLMAAAAILSEQQGIMQVVLIGICFNLPYVLLSAFAGSAADRYGKTAITRATKLLELLLMIAALVFTARHNTSGLLAVLFLMGAQSALFSPAKYGLLPELLDEGNISKGNGYIELLTFAAIIAGTALGGVLTTYGQSTPYLPGSIMVTIAVFGLAISFLMRQMPAADPGRPFSYNPLQVRHALREIRQNHALYQALVGITFFWAFGSLYQLNFPLYGKQLGGWTDMEVSAVLAVLGLGIGLGSLAAGMVSEGKVELGLVPIGAAGLSGSSILLTTSYSSYSLTLSLAFVLGLSSGFFIVPLQSYFQEQSPPEKRGAFIAASNFVSFAAMTIASLLLLLLRDVFALHPGHVFFVFGAATIAVTCYILTVLPRMLLRCMNWILIHTLYRTRVVARENVPVSGGALLVANHVSFVDPPLLLASLGRHVRFLMYRPLYEAKLLHPIAKLMAAIPVGASRNREEAGQPLIAAHDAIKCGELVGIFAEGSITRIVHMLRFRKGLERIMKGLDAPIVPVHLDQVWGSVFSYRNGRFFWKMPRTVPYPVTISFGKPLPSTATAFEVRQAVQELSADAFRLRDDAFQVLHQGFVASCKQRLFSIAVADSSGRAIRGATLLASVLAFSRWVRTSCGGENMVGVLLPPSAAGVIANVGLLIAGKVPVNLNYTSGKEAQLSAVQQCGIRTVVTSRQVLSKIAFLGLSPEELQQPGLPKIAAMEDYASSLKTSRRIGFFAAAIFLPRRLIEVLFFARKFTRDDIATVIFSSGSTGEPKGVLLSHGNISGNITSIFEMFDWGRSECVIGVLPFFHSFGFTGTLWLPLLAGMKTIYHHNPMDAAVIGRLVEQHRASILMGTPTFLAAYLRRCTKEQFASLRYAFCGAEKLKEKLARAFAEKFGVEPKEGYGATELSPLAIANVENRPGKGELHTGTKLGTVGRPIPGVAVRIVDPDTFAPLPVGQDGLLLVRGANVMLGYLNQPKKTQEVLRDGWYVTGDIARIDEDGFITITDRLSRFSKIGGEMVPHIRVEEAIHEVLDEKEMMCAVAAVPDEKRGEQLVVLATKPIEARAMAKKLAEQGLPNLWIPAADRYFTVESLPLLGSGKLDLRAIKSMAAQCVAEVESPGSAGEPSAL